MRLIRCKKVPPVGGRVRLYSHARLVAEGVVRAVESGGVHVRVGVDVTELFQKSLWLWDTGLDRWFVWSQEPYMSWKLYWMRELK